MSGKKVGKYLTFRRKNFARLKSSANGKRAFETGDFYKYMIRERLTTIS